MSKKHDFNIPVISLSHQSGICISKLLGDLETSWPDCHAEALVRAFQKVAQKELIDQGEHIELMRYTFNHPSEPDIISLTIPASEKRFESESFEMEMDVLLWKLSNNEWFALAPAVAVANVASNKEAVKKILAETVMLEFFRNRRADNQRSLIATQWYAPPISTVHTAGLEFLTPAEVSAKRRRIDDPVVAKTARRMRFAQFEAVSLDKYVDEFSRNILGDYRQSVLVVGASGSGKTALIHEFVRQQQKTLARKPWQTTASQLLRVLTEAGGWQYALGRWVSELRRSADIMYIGNLAELFEVGQYLGNNISIAEALRDALQRNEITLIAEVTVEQLEKIEVLSPGYCQLFYNIRFADRSIEEENQIAAEAVKLLAKQMQIDISEASIKRIIYLQRRYAPYSGYPGKTIRFFETLALQASKQDNVINEQGAIRAFCEDSGMPEFLIAPLIKFDISLAAEFFKQRIIGQTEAIDELINSLLTIKSGMARSGRPIISALFVGPTGVGKTQMAKTLAEYMFADEKRMIRFDMSEYSDAYAVTRLTTTSEASLVTKVRQQPFSIILFDEIEKADISFFDLLLQVLDEGRLTDNSGGVANFCASIIIMTSNIGAQEFSAAKIGFASDDHHDSARKHFEDAVTRYFRPELFNRLDVLVPFTSLNIKQQKEILRREINQLKTSAAIAGRPITLSVEDDVHTLLTNGMLDTKYGARAVHRIIQQELSWPLAVVLSHYSQETPLIIQIANVQNNVEVSVSVGNKDQKNTNNLNQLADRASQDRSLIQHLLEGAIWIGVLSELDKLEVKKRKMKQGFWLDPQLVEQYQDRDGLRQRLHTLLESAFQIEEETLGLLQEDDAELIMADYGHALDKIREEFFQLVIDINSIVNTQHNSVVIGIYSDIQSTQHMLTIYEAWMASLGLEFEVANIYFKIPPGKNNITGDKNVKLANKQAKEIVQSQGADNYVVSDKPIQKSNYKLIGKTISLTGPSVALFFVKEAGFVQIDGQDEKKKQLFTDVKMLALSTYVVPQGVHLKKYYKNVKPVRRIKGDEYSDNRYGFNDYALFAPHYLMLQRQRENYLLASLLQGYQAFDEDDA